MKNLFTMLLIVSFWAIALPNYAQISCTSHLQVSLTDDGTARIYPDFMLEGNVSGSFEVSINNSTFAPFQDIDCSYLGSNQVTVRNTTTGNTCWGQMTVEDKLNPIPYMISLSTALLQNINCSVEIWAVDFDAGSTDGCGIATYSFGSNGYFPDTTVINDTLIDLSVDHYFNDQGIIVDDFTPSAHTLSEYALGNLNKWNASVKSASKNFFESDAGNLEVSVTDGSGNHDYAIVSLNLTSCLTGVPSCTSHTTFGTSPWPADIVIEAHDFLNGVSNYDSVQVSFDQVTYVDNFTMGCSDIGTYSIFVKYTYQGLESECPVTFDVVDVTPPVVVVNQGLTRELADLNDVVTLTPADVDNGSYDACTSVTMSLSKSTFDINNLGSNKVYLRVEDEYGNWNETWTTVTITFNGACAITESDIVWPNDKLQINDANANPTQLAPDQLVTDYGFVDFQVRPNITLNCGATAMTYDDTVINFSLNGNNYFKIVRNWTVLDWISGNLFTYVQIIRNDPVVNDFICDFLPRIAPLGDCASGHTDTDDVEWPNDIALDDHRISPAELVSISNVDPLDAEPSFYNEPSQYSATYEDILIALSATEIELGRRWVATRLDNGFTYNYTQLISIDISTFGSLVTVSDPSGRAVSGVEINGNLMTDDRGRALVSSDVSSIEKEANSDAITIRDAYLIQEDVYQVEELVAVAKLAGDINNDGNVSSLDAALALRTILDINISQDELDLRFIENTEELQGSKPKASYLAYKPGDTDLSFGSPESYVVIENGIALKDQLLNAGESYRIPVLLNKAIELEALDLTFNFDSDLISVDGASSDLLESPAGNVEGDKIQVVMLLSSFSDVLLLGDEIFFLEITVKENTLVSEAFDISSDQNIILADGKVLYRTDININNKILTPTFEIEGKLSTLNVYPNPAQDMVNFQLAEGLNLEQVVLFDLLGSVVLVSKDVSQINVQDLDNGVYIYQAQFENQVVSGKIEVIK